MSEKCQTCITLHFSYTSEYSSIQFNAKPLFENLWGSLTCNDVEIEKFRDEIPQIKKFQRKIAQWKPLFTLRWSGLNSLSWIEPQTSFILYIRHRTVNLFSFIFHNFYNVAIFMLYFLLDSVHVLQHFHYNVYAALVFITL